MNSKLKIVLAGFFLLNGLAASSNHASAQVLTINNDTSASNNSPWVISGSTDFNTDSDGVSALSVSAPGYTTNIGATLASLALSSGITVPTNLLAETGSGWVLNNSNGLVVISADNNNYVALGDPFVAYNYSFFNSSSSTAPFSMTFSVNFPLETYGPSNPGFAKASFGYSLTDATPDGTGVSASPTQTATLSFGPSSTNVGVDIPAPTIPTSVAQGDTVTVPNRQPSSGYILGPDGSFNTLTVTVSGTYSSGAEVGVTGRVDVVPEPSTSGLLLGGLGALAISLLCSFRRARR